MSIEPSETTGCGCGRHGGVEGGALNKRHESCHGENASRYCSTKTGQWIRVVRDFIKLLQFGEVHLTVHKGRVIEVRKVEKVRFDMDVGSH